MIVEDKKIEKICSFYVSDFHLEMILVPYINDKLEKHENVEIITERDLTETIEILTSKMNIKNKEKILNMGWNKSDINNLDNNTNVIIIGTQEYIKNLNKKINDSSFENVKIVNCFDFEEIKEEIGNIINNHDKSLNTLGFDNI